MAKGAVLFRAAFFVERMIEANETLKPYRRGLRDWRGNGSKRSAEGGSVGRWGEAGKVVHAVGSLSVRLPARDSAGRGGRDGTGLASAGREGRDGTGAWQRPVAEAATVRGLAAPGRGGRDGTGLASAGRGGRDGTGLGGASRGGRDGTVAEERNIK